MNQDGIKVKIKIGQYRCSLPYDLDKDKFSPCCMKNSKSSDKFCSDCGKSLQELRDERKKARDEYHKEDRRLQDLFQQDALEYVGLSNHPKKDIIFSRAWEKGHATGYETVLEELEELASFLESIK